jgi:hypothetical protein
VKDRRIKTFDKLASENEELRKAQPATSGPTPKQILADKILDEVKQYMQL